MTETKHPWDIGPTELIGFALENMHGGSDFNRRLSFLILDVGIETLLKTFLSLTPRVTGAQTSFTKRKNAIDGSFNDLVTGMREAIPERSETLNLDYVSYYHGIRNSLYHQGTTVGTVRQDQLEGYAKLAVRCLNELLDVDLSSALEAPGGPEPKIVSEEGFLAGPSLKAYRKLLTRRRIPPGQLGIYKALYEAGDRGLTSRELQRALGKPASFVAGALGSLGNRIAHTPGFERVGNIYAVFDINPAVDGGWRYMMLPVLRDALEAENIFEKYKAALEQIGGKSNKEITPRNKLYAQFFDELSGEYWKTLPQRRQPKAHPQSWYSFGAGRTGFSFSWAFRSDSRFSAEIYIDTEIDSTQNAKYLNQLKESVGQLPAGLSDIKWEELPSARSCRIVLYRDGDIEMITANPKLKTEIISWGIEKMRLLEQTFRNPIKALPRNNEPQVLPPPKDLG